MPLAIAAISLLLVGLIGYWLFIHTEGVFLGQRVVTWLYDIYAKRYDRIKGFDAATESSYLGRPITHQLRSLPGAVILDIGTGTGRLPLALCEEPVFQGRIIGIDDSLEMLRQARFKTALHGDRIRLLWGDSMALPFTGGLFDAVTALEMLEFTPDPVAQVREAVRVLAPGGLFVITRRRSMPVFLMPGHIFSENAFTALMAEVGLMAIERHIWQVDYDLYLARKPGASLPSSRRHLSELLSCPSCSAVRWDDSSPSSLSCLSCGRVLPVSDGILHLKG